jgi:hypothetical protein
MTVYTMNDGKDVNTEHAVQVWNELTIHHESIHFGAATGYSTDHQKLYRSNRGCFWLEYWSDSVAEKRARYLSSAEAVRWLRNNHCELPDDLQDFTGPRSSQ